MGRLRGNIGTPLGVLGSPRLPLEILGGSMGSPGGAWGSHGNLLREHREQF